ncbi:fosfomycin resistance glutathione transferase [Cellvibrio fibrivorans]|uniref:Catechol 2,3-dioxygenase-like lactoylglutathione lyase family enzyme n=1 Tax=Cellvibrio fibrivorans TaxID=126350 RepID=A0ABU1UYZ3_9GAMM|nr:fosfomycin resistance glutathione transferase [Cellvibrio fibrivorans]MDR7090422.1 catechol 2,3-dioxygenase-like lactoylglutathione lyase family enzyme [Cellvibrio fibrivorans]
MLRGLNHITIAVGDLDTSFDFYIQLLGFKPLARWDAGAYLSLGDLWLCLSCDTAIPSQDYSHIALDCAEDKFNLIAAQLREAKVVEWKQNTSEGDSLYFLDPDGHKLEIHCGNLQTRLDSLKESPYKGLVWF